MMAKHISSWVVILLVLCLFVVAHAKDMPNKEMKKIQEAAQEGIQSFLRDADPQVSYQIGFSNREEIDNAKIGKGFQVFTLSKDELLSDSSKKADLYSLTFPTDMWIFPIVSNNKAISTVIVDRMDNS